MRAVKPSSTKAISLELSKPITRVEEPAELSSKSTKSLSIDAEKNMHTRIRCVPTLK